MVYKLTYFDARGRAEPIRIILSAANVDFEDNRISKVESWPSLKKSMPWGQIPILEFEGKVIAQSITICRYLARKYNFAGSNHWESALCDEYVDALNDLLGDMKTIIHAENEQIRATRKEKFLQETLPKCLNKFEKILENQTNSSFLVGNSLTWADIILVTMLERLEMPNYAGPTLLNKTDYRNLKMLKIAVFTYPGIKEWIAIRPKE